MKKSKSESKKTGPEPERVKTDKPWDKAVQNALKKKRPKDGWPKYALWITKNYPFCNPLLALGLLKYILPSLCKCFFWMLHAPSFYGKCHFSFIRISIFF